MHLAATALAALVLAASSHGVSFKGLKADPMICTGEGDDQKCCGYLTKKDKEVKCKGPQYLHPAMRPVAACLTKTLQVTNNPDVCEQGLRETFRGRKLQDSYKSIPGNWSFHNWGLAIDVCSYFKSGDCTQANLINKVLGGVFTWKTGGKLRCQAQYRKKGVAGPSKDVVAKVLANTHYAQTQAAVKKCYADSGVPYGESNWGVLWKDYFDGPHFQYLASQSAGFYKKKKAKTGPHVFAKLLEDCYEGDRMSMLADLYEQDDPVQFIRSKEDGCGAKANDLFDDYIEQSYPDGFSP